MRKSVALWMLLGVGLLGARASVAATAEDDLALVRKAVQKDTGAEGTKGKPTWVHIRVEGKKEKKEKVSINVPFAVVEALGDEHVFHTHIKGDQKEIRLADILKNLEAGQQLVEVDDEEETVRIWVD